MRSRCLLGRLGQNRLFLGFPYGFERTILTFSTMRASIKWPACRCCGRQWKPNEGVVAAISFCGVCTKERLERATIEHGLVPLHPDDLVGDYLHQQRRRAI